MSALTSTSVRAAMSFDCTEFFNRQPHPVPSLLVSTQEVSQKSRPSAVWSARWPLRSKIDDGGGLKKTKKVERRPSSRQDLTLPHEHGFEPATDAAVQRAASAPPVTCLFCLRDDASLNTVINEKETFYARFDNFPATLGHVEVVPKRHVESFFDLNDSEILDAYSLMQAVEKELAALHGPGGYTIGVNEGKVAGRSIDHLHIHLIPRYEGDVADPRGGIRQVVPNCDPDAWVTATQPSSPAQ